ncbi:hypothetical protein [Urbifossiella limnaea]|uniref:Uncharacterized protein n=1 Tax=Urbifossiella limnaea TaxID=2528023 RepID=A0A517Y0L9_9BACT|nr:hypothetical protein [Urbifossiella limnaea]QDU23306.1 hypothetical protein ETAA1_53010 [Urbifossiella limnaea]
MKVSGWKDTSSDVDGNTYGLRLRFEDRDRVFGRRRPKAVFLLLGNASYRIPLLPGFWNECPEFRDNAEQPTRRLLGLLNLLCWKKRKPPKFELVHLGKDRFRLHPEPVTAGGDD